MKKIKELISRIQLYLMWPVWYNIGSTIMIILMMIELFPLWTAAAFLFLGFSVWAIKRVKKS